MMNIEKHYKEILKNKDSFAVNEQTGKVSRCSKIICENCKFYYANSCYEYDNCEEAKLSWLFEENEESNSILTEEEKVIIKNIIKAFEPFGKKLSYIAKKECYSNTQKHYLAFRYKNDSLCTLDFNNDELFEGMESDVDYTLEELGLC